MIWKKSLFMSAPVLFAFMCVVSIHTATLSAQLPPPAHDPEVAMATAAGAHNTPPFFVQSNGPVREARFKFQADGVTRDGGVHDIYVITGRSDAPSGCQIMQEDFDAQNARGNVIFRIPTP